MMLKPSSNVNSELKEDRWGEDNFDLNALYEETIRQIKKRSAKPFRVAERSKVLSSVYQYITSRGVIYFKTESGTTKGLFWTQQIRLVGLRDLIKKYGDDPDTLDKEIVQRAIKGDIKVYCNCKAFKFWGWKYISWKRGVGMYKEDRDPIKRNKKHQGTVCKHLYSVLTVLPFLSTRITKDLRKLRILNRNDNERNPNSRG